MKPKLYSYFRSSASYRVRIALYLKEIDFEYAPVSLIKDGGEQHSDGYIQKNPMGQVPSFSHNDQIINQSMAILFYIDETWPEPNLFPKDLAEKAKALEICELVNSGIQPLQNLFVGQTLLKDYNLSKKQVNEWGIYWMTRGARALEKILSKSSSQFCLGDKITAADLFLVPQVYNFIRYKIDLKKFPNIQKVYDNCMKQEAFLKAEPHRQPDTPENLKS